MQARGIRVLLCLICLVLTSVSGAQNKTPSVLDRVQKVDDPELAELIRVAMENHDDLNQSARLDLIREVTRLYVQVKLLDQQIVEVTRKLEGETGPAEMRYELLMAKTELEAKRMTELADLRKVMGVMPRHPFDKHPIEALHSLLHLDPLEQGVVLMDTDLPFVYWGVHQWQSGGLLSRRS